MPVRMFALCLGCVCLLLPLTAVAQATAQPTPPALEFESVPDFLKLPPGTNFGEVSGVAVNSKGHVFVFTRSASAGGPAYAPTAAQLLEFGPKGEFIKEIGKGNYGWSFAHTVRIDKDDNIWAVDKGSDMVIKFTPAGRIVEVYGRRKESADDESKPWEHVTPPLPPVDGLFRQPTDVAWDSQGNLYVTDGYINSRVAKFSKAGDWVKSWGERGKGPGQFDIPHAVVIDRNDRIYVGDRTNRRIQVFDTDGRFLRMFTIDVPAPPDTRPVNGNTPTGDRRAAVIGAPNSICITPGPNQVLFVGETTFPGRIFKVTLEGQVLGVIGRSGRQLKQFSGAHQLDCPSETEVYVAETSNWRVQKLLIRPPARSTAGRAALPGRAPAAAASPTTAVTGAGSFSPIVANLQKTLTFYALLGFEVPEGSTASPRPFSMNPRLHSMMGTNGASERHVNARVPGGFALEPIEFAAIDQRPARPRIQDPGAITLVAFVRDIDALLAKATQAGVPVLTPGGKPVALARKTRAVLIEDPDGRPVELRQVDPLPETTTPASSNVIGSRLVMTVADTDRTMRLYRDQFGFGFEGSPAFTADADLQALTGLKGGQVRHSTMAAPGGRMTIELLEFKGVTGTPLRSRIQDPGSARIQLRVGKADAVLAMVTATGSRSISAGDRPVKLPPNLLGVMVPDADNLYLTLLESCGDGCAPRDEAVGYTATGHEPWYGTWKLSPTKSHYQNGSQGSQSTVTKVELWEGGIKYVTDSVNAQGQKGHTEWNARFDNTDYPVTGVATVDSYGIQRIDERTYAVIAKKNGLRTTLSTTTIAADGKTRTVRQTGTQVGGADVNNTLIYERQ